MLRLFSFLVMVSFLSVSARAKSPWPTSNQELEVLFQKSQMPDLSDFRAGTAVWGVMASGYESLRHSTQFDQVHGVTLEIPTTEGTKKYFGEWQTKHSLLAVTSALYASVKNGTKKPLEVDLQRKAISTTDTTATGDIFYTAYRKATLSNGARILVGKSQSYFGDIFSTRKKWSAPAYGYLVLLYPGDKVATAVEVQLFRELGLGELLPMGTKLNVLRIEGGSVLVSKVEDPSTQGWVRIYDLY